MFIVQKLAVPRTTTTTTYYHRHSWVVLKHTAALPSKQPLLSHPHPVSHYICRHTDNAEPCFPLMCVRCQCLPSICVFPYICKVDVTHHHCWGSTNGPCPLQSPDDKTLLKSSLKIKSRRRSSSHHVLQTNIYVCFLSSFWDVSGNT